MYPPSEYTGSETGDTERNENRRRDGRVAGHDAARGPQYSGCRDGLDQHNARIPHEEHDQSEQITENEQRKQPADGSDERRWLDHELGKQQERKPVAAATNERTEDVPANPLPIHDEQRRRLGRGWLWGRTVGSVTLWRANGR